MWNPFSMGSPATEHPHFVPPIVVLAFFVQFAISSVYGQGSWELISPKLGNNTRESIRATASGLVLAVGESGSIVRSADMGTTWEVVQTNTNAWLFGLAISPEGRCLAVGQGGTILSSVDSGLSWQQQQSGTQSGLLTAQWLNDTMAIAAGQGGTVLRTTDRGVTWTDRSSTTEQFESIYFITDKVGIAATRKRILRTTDAGDTWESRYSVEGADAVHFADSLTGFAVNFFTRRAFKTTDGGITWEIAYDWEGQFKTSAVFCIDSATALIGGEGAIVQTTNGGQSFETSLATTNWISDIFFVSPLVGFACDQGGTLWRTSDGGVSWENATADLIGNLWSVSFWSEAGGVISGSDPTIYITADSGKTWTARSTPTTLNPLVFVDSLYGFAIGFEREPSHPFRRIPIILRTTDSGFGWERLPPMFFPVTHLTGIGFWNRQQGCVIGNINPDYTLPGLLASYTSDGGNTWARGTFYGPPTLHALSIVNDSTTASAIYNSNIVRTTDGGTTWTQQNAGELLPGNSIHFISPLLGFYVGNGGTILNSRDGGVTWIAQQSGTSEDLNTVFFASPLLGVAAGSNGTLLSTHDGGEHWRFEPRLTSRNLSKVFVSDLGRVFVLGNRGTLIRGQLGIPIGQDLTLISDELPNRPSLEQSYPNPFNADTRIRFSLRSDERVTILVYSTLGEMIGRLVDTQLPAGTYEYTWRPDNLASGIYLYRLQTQTYSAVKKLIYLK